MLTLHFIFTIISFLNEVLYIILRITRIYRVSYIMSVYERMYYKLHFSASYLQKNIPLMFEVDENENASDIFFNF